MDLVFVFTMEDNYIASDEGPDLPTEMVTCPWSSSVDCSTYFWYLNVTNLLVVNIY